MKDVATGFEDQRGPEPRNVGAPTPGKGEETDSALEPPEGASPTDTPISAPRGPRGASARQIGMVIHLCWA